MAVNFFSANVIGCCAHVLWWVTDDSREVKRSILEFGTHGHMPIALVLVWYRCFGVVSSAHLLLHGSERSTDSLCQDPLRYSGWPPWFLELSLQGTVKSNEVMASQPKLHFSL